MCFQIELLSILGVSLSSEWHDLSHTFEKASLQLMPSSHLPRTPCDKFVYDFPCDLVGIVGGYGLWLMCSHCLGASCDIFYAASGATRDKSVQRLCRDFTEIVPMSVRLPCSLPQPPHWNRTEPVRGSAFAQCPCGDCAMPPTTCLRAMGLRFFQNCKTSR